MVPLHSHLVADVEQAVETTKRELAESFEEIESY
jgi:hypothetical protein